MDDRRRCGIEAYASQLGLDPADVPEWFSERFGERFAEEAINAAAGAWVGNNLDLRERSLIVVAALVAQGGLDERLRGHVRWAVAHGATREQLEEAVTLLATYVGYPKASIAMEIVRAELDIIESDS